MKKRIALLLSAVLAPLTDIRILAVFYTASCSYLLSFSESARPVP